MSETDDRRAQRSQQLLRQALAELISQKRFDKITVQDIIDRAGVGRTTFYAHFQSKEDLFLSNHDHIIDTLSRSFMPRAGVWASEPSPDLIRFLEMLTLSRDSYYFLTAGSEGEVFRLIGERVAQNLGDRLRETFREEDSSIPFDVLAQQVAGSMVSVVRWWMERRRPYGVQEMAALLYQMNLVVLRNALEKKSSGPAT